MKNILVVDDEFHVREMLADMLSGNGYRIFTADGGDAAMRILDEQPMDLVLLDVNMPGKNGFIVCKEIGERAQVPVLFVSGCPNMFSGEFAEFASLWQQRFALGDADILYKPFSVESLEEKVSALIEG